MITNRFNSNVYSIVDYFYGNQEVEPKHINMIQFNNSVGLIFNYYFVLYLVHQ